MYPVRQAGVSAYPQSHIGEGMRALHAVSFWARCFNEGRPPIENLRLCIYRNPIAVDSEVLWHWHRRQSSVHGMLHSAACAAILGLGVGAAIRCCGRSITSMHPATFGCNAHAEWNWAGVLAGGVLGGITHSLLDAFMYQDVQPFSPITSDNPLFSVVGARAIQHACLATAVVGAIWLIWRLYVARTPA